MTLEYFWYQLMKTYSNSAVFFIWRLAESFLVWKPFEIKTCNFSWSTLFRTFTEGALLEYNIKRATRKKMIKSNQSDLKVFGFFKWTFTRNRNTIQPCDLQTAFPFQLTLLHLSVFLSCVPSFFLLNQTLLALVCWDGKTDFSCFSPPGWQLSILHQSSILLFIHSCFCLPHRPSHES